MNWIVICRGDSDGGQLGAYELATRTVFVDAESAAVYAATIAASREPMAIPGRFDGLRFGEPRGTAAYWSGK